MFFLLFACLAPDLAGDAVYPSNQEDLPISEPALGNSEVDEVDESGGNMLDDIQFTESNSDAPSSIVLDIEDNMVHVTHYSVLLSCDMNQYSPDRMDDGSNITIYYMPLEDPRECLYDVQFYLYLNSGTYTLTLMEDSTEFTIE